MSTFHKIWYCGSTQKCVDTFQFGLKLKREVRIILHETCLYLCAHLERDLLGICQSKSV